MASLQTAGSDAALAERCCRFGDDCVEAGLARPDERSALFAKALEYFEYALQLAPDCLAACLGLAYLAALGNSFARAVDALAAAARIAPGDPRIRVLYQEIENMRRKQAEVPDFDALRLGPVMRPIPGARPQRLPEAARELAGLDLFQSIRFQGVER